MDRIIRTSAATVCGFVVGLAIGPVSVLMANASDTLARGWAWPEVDTKYALLLLTTSVPAGVNGAVSAALAAGLGRRRRLDVTLLPAALHVAAAVFALAVAVDEFLLLQLIALVFTVVMWPAGRLGQVVGCAIREAQSKTGSGRLGSPKE